MNQGQAHSALTDEELWCRYQQGDQQALEVVHDRVGLHLQAFLASKCRPPLDADDALQEVLVNAVRSCQQYNRQKGLLIQWLIAIAKNVVTDMLRKRHDEESLGASPWDIPAPQHDDRESDQLVALRECLELLGGDFVAVLRQRFLEERSFEDIAEEMKLKGESTVNSRLNRGKKAVKDCVERKLS